MKGKVKAIPDGYHTVTPYLVVQDARGLMDFLRQVFHAQDLRIMEGPDGRISHAEMQIGDSVVMLSDSGPNFSPMPTMLHLYLEDTNTAYKRALDAGATSIREPSDQFYGDRTAGVQDRFGNQWWMATHIEDVSDEEMQRRMQARSQQQGSA